MIPPIARRLPLVRRRKEPALPLQSRIDHLAGLAVEPAGASHRDQVARACAALNYAALIASDLGMPQTAADLCWRQFHIFTKAPHLSGEIAVMGLMPLVNLSRLLTRSGDGEGAYSILTRLYQAAQERTSTRILGRDVDLGPFTQGPDHRPVCQELWSVLLVDGARALARLGRWTQAADAMRAHRGVGTRLLDGRQVLIMSLLEQDLYEQARATIDASAPTEPWESTVLALLRASCPTQGAFAPDEDIDTALREASTALSSPHPEAAVFQTRVGLAALDLPHEHTNPDLEPLRQATAAAAALDAYAAREALAHCGLGPYLSHAHHQRLTNVLTAAGIDTGELPTTHRCAFTTAIDQAALTVRRTLECPSTSPVSTPPTR
ncbi:hypothetical protein [Nocardiopsis alborubida]|uniref:hypothetical protein n=1 Tax=Nocardiopsis alborubida TaxID=146802 RepID=UPI00076E392C|nr:hypothetical protein [Nocardiopsis alborubida]